MCIRDSLHFARAVGFLFQPRDVRSEFAFFGLETLFKVSYVHGNWSEGHFQFRISGLSCPSE